MHPDQLPPALQTVIARVVKAERRRAHKQAENARKEVFASLGEVLVKSLPSLLSKSAAHAPAGGVTVGGKEYVGGQFIPAEVMAEATAEERAAVEGRATDKPADADPDRKAITDRLDGFGSAEDLEAEHDDLHEELHERMLAAEDDDEADRLADLIAFADEELERLKQEIEDSDVQVVEDDDTDESGDTARDELAAGDWHPVHADDWLSENNWQHEDPTEAAWDFRKSQAANRARFEKQLTAQAAADAAQVADFAAQAEARVKDLTGDDTDAATIREFAKDATAAIEDATAEYTTAAADYYDADKEAYKAEQKVPEGAMSTADIDALESAADRYREMRLKAAEKFPPADRDAEVERIEQQHEKRLSGVDRRAAKMKDKADQLAAVRDQQAARYESARSAYATTLREQVAAIQSAAADIANGFTGRTAKSITRFAKSLGLSLQLDDLKEGVRRGVAADVWAWDDLLASVGDELGLERVTKAERSHLVRKVIRNRLGRRQVVWVKPQDAEAADRGVPVGEDGKPTGEKPAPVAKTREQLAESRTVLAAAVNDPDRLNPEQVRQLADHIDSITKDEAKGLLKQLGAKVSGDQMAVAGRLLEAIRAGRGAGGVGEALRRAGNKTTGQYGAWGQAAGGGERPASRDTLPKRGVSAEEAKKEQDAKAAEFEARMESIDPRDSGRVEVPEPVRPLEPDDADRERYDAARERLDRMQAWAADKPNDLRAEEQVRRAEGRLREVVGEEGEERREPVARAVPAGPRPVSELTDAEIEAERRALPRNRRTPAQAERDIELTRENARRNPIPPGGGTPFPLLGGGPGPGNNDRSDERTAQQPPAPRVNYQTLRKQAAEGMAAGAAAMQQPHDGSGLPDIPLYAPLSAEQRADLDAQRRAAKTRQEARGVELLASQMATEAESARRSDAAKAAKAAKNPPRSPAGAVDNPAPVGNTTPVQPQPAGANQGGGGMTTASGHEIVPTRTGEFRVQFGSDFAAFNRFGKLVNSSQYFTPPADAVKEIGDHLAAANGGGAATPPPATTPAGKPDNYGETHTARFKVKPTNSRDFAKITAKLRAAGAKFDDESKEWRIPAGEAHKIAGVISGLSRLMDMNHGDLGYRDWQQGGGVA